MDSIELTFAGPIARKVPKSACGRSAGTDPRQVPGEMERAVDMTSPGAAEAADGKNFFSSVGR